MDPVRLGRSIRVVRVQRAQRQADVAAQARVSPSKVARIERGDLARIPIGDIERVATSMGAVLDVQLRWRGEALDRLLDGAHAVLVEGIVSVLRSAGWDVGVEMSFNLAGERGVIDVLAFHGSTGMLLVVEVKSIVPDAQAMLANLDRKARVAAAVARERGWEAREVSRLFVIGDGSTARRRINHLGETFGAAYPTRGAAVRTWLHAPVGRISGLLFFPYRHGVTPGRSSVARQRVRRRRSALKSAISGTG